MAKSAKMMAEAKRAEGVGVLMITPLNKDYSLNEENLRKEVEWCIKNGAHGLWPLGYIGEWTVLEEETKRRVMEIVADQAKGRVYIAAGCHGINTLQIIRLVNYAQELGYDCGWISPTTPRPMTPDEIYGFYKMIHDKTTLPIGLYSTYAMGVYIRPSLMKKISELERMIVGKDAIGDYCHIAGIYHEGVHKNMTVLGVPNNMAPHMVYGGGGCTCAPQDLCLSLGVYNAIRAGDWDKAWKLQLTLTAEWPILMAEALAGRVFGAKVTSSIQGFTKAKASLAMGIEMGPPMPPYLPATEAEIKFAKEQLGMYPKEYWPKSL
jgi:dihydrodipicolinate synthase/N-acetylneuraminate lyase